MATTDNLGDFLTSVANAIRSKSGSTAQINAQDFVNEIENLPSGGINKLPQVVDKTITSLTAEDLQGATSIGNYGFFGCSGLTSVSLPSSVTSIGDSAFFNCYSLTSIEISNSVTSIDDLAFRSCIGLTSITFGENSKLASIGNSAFYDCRSLTSITIPNSMTSIDYQAFAACSSLTTMTVLATTPPTLSNTNAISTAIKKIYIPAGTLSAYQSATNWSNFASLFEELPA